MARQPSTTLALARIETEEKTTDLKLRLKGKLAVDLADYRRAYVETNGQSVELDQLVDGVLRMGHQAEYVSALVAHARDVVHRPVEVLAGGVAQHELARAVHPRQRPGVGIPTAP